MTIRISAGIAGREVADDLAWNVAVGLGNIIPAEPLRETVRMAEAHGRVLRRLGWEAP